MWILDIITGRRKRRPLRMKGTNPLTVSHPPDLGDNIPTTFEGMGQYVGCITCGKVLTHPETRGGYCSKDCLPEH